MLTKIISLKDYRNNITNLWKESNNKNVRYIVLYHSKPILEVKPYQQETIMFNHDEETEDYYKTLEQNLEFWKDPVDDNIFKID